jgi:hypothetical protein
MGLFSSASSDAKQAKHEAKQAKEMDRLIKSQRSMSRREMDKVARQHGKGK